MISGPGRGQRLVEGTTSRPTLAAPAPGFLSEFDGASPWPHRHGSSENGWGSPRARVILGQTTTRRSIMHFRIQGLPAERFASLFSLSDHELAQQGAVRR